MPYFLIEDFKGGLDHRRIPAASPPGTLQVLRNAVINRGGEIESAKSFTQEWLAVKPDNTPYAIRGLFPSLDRVVTFCHEQLPDSPDLTPVPVGTYILFVPLDTGGVPISRVIAACQFSTGYFSIPVISGIPRPYYNGLPIANTEPIYTDRANLVDCITYKSNVYALSKSTLYRSKIDDAQLWKPTTDIGAFAIDLPSTGLARDSATALGIYDNFVVVYGRNQIQFWSMDPDPAKCVLVRQLNSVGAFVSHSVAEYSDRDAFFVADAGVRSLRVRDSSGAATVNDVGDPIDPLVRPLIGTTLESYFAGVEPKTGRYFVVFPNTSIYAYSRSDGISAWSEIRPDFYVENFATAAGRLFARSGNQIYLYGGPFDNRYDTAGSLPIMQTPFFDMGKPATTKIVHGIDAAIEGEWLVEICSSVDRPDAWEILGTISGTTYNRPRISLRVVGTHFALRFTGVGTPGLRRLSNVAVHYDLGEAG